VWLTPAVAEAKTVREREERGEVLGFVLEAGAAKGGLSREKYFPAPPMGFPALPSPIAYRHFGLIPCFYAGRNTALWLAENISLSLLSTL